VAPGAQEWHVSRDAVEVETGRDPQAAVIWLHGLGADGHDFEPIVPEFIRPGERTLRFVFPHAPIRPVTLNGGYAMRAWYDIAALDRRTTEDENGIRASQTAIDTLIRRENARGIRSERIVLAGFSQGGAMALFAGTRYPERLAGIMGLSCYQVLAAQFAAERSAANQSTPVFLAHGTQDPVVAPLLGEEARRQLEAAGYSVEWHAYSMPHSVCPEEVADIAAWLRRVLP
jgi:phospholipase/carboxylesterase